jgi:predicted alpha/beta superfamily hydrolase
MLVGFSGPTSTVTFDVIVPADTPGTATVAVIGNMPALGGGSPPGLVLERQEDGHYRGSVALPVGKKVTYSLQLTSPAASELDKRGRPAARRTLTVGRKEVTRKLTVAAWRYAQGQPALTLRVTVPPETPPDARIWISGNRPELGEWSGAGVELARRPGGFYEGQLTFPRGTRLEFKITRGSWEVVEKGPDGEEKDNRVHTVEGNALLALTVARWRDQGDAPPDSLTGHIRYHRRVGEGRVDYVKPRDLIVYLPPDYETATTRRYPVLYLHDGQNMMDAATSFSGEWGADETAQELIQKGEIEPVILVGVYNTEDRMADYTPVLDQRHGGGDADDYGRYLVEVVKPLIDATYRTKPEPQFTGLAGSSLGGLVSMYLGLTRSNTFTRLGVLSPTVFWADRDILGRVRALRARTPVRVWLDIGTDEASSGETVEDAQALRDALMAKGWTPGKDLSYLVVEGGQHSEAAWRARFGQVLKYLYPPR